jgi:branched-chain amino acid transport system substrate-binding protein
VAFGIYEGVMIAADAIKRAGSTDANAVREALVKSNYKGILGPITFDANQQSHNNLMLMTVNNGSLGVKELVSGK